MPRCNTALSVSTATHILKRMDQSALPRPDDYFALFRERHPDASACFSAPSGSGEPAVVSVVGVLDSETSTDFLEGALLALARLPGSAMLELRLEGVRFISSSGVGALTRLLAAAEGRGVALRVSGLSPACEDVFSVLGLLDYLNITGTDAESAPD